MTMTNASPTVKGRRVKFTPEALQKIKDLVAEGISREGIANRTWRDCRVPPSHMFKVRHQLATNYFAQRLKAPHGRCQGMDYSYSGLGRHCARPRAEGSIAAGSLRRACGQVRDNDATPRHRAHG